jgi:ABC-type transport system involved in multi-copper enzyme maturation permease subunit
MIWLTWRQFRGGAVMMAAALAVLAAILSLTGPGLADDYSTGIAACTSQSGGCSDFVERFFDDNLIPLLAVTAVVLVLPALIGVFWGAPLIARELEAGTHRLVWNQSITRTRWLAVKLGLTGLAAMIAAGLGSLGVTWWSSPIDKAATELPRMEPLMFAARGIVPIGYAAFAFALGVTVGMLVRRTIPAMAITLAIFVAGQIAMPLLVRPHLIPPTRSTIELTESNIDGFHWDESGEVLQVWSDAGPADAWVLSSHSVDPSGHAVDTISMSSSSGPCAPPTGRLDEGSVTACLAEIQRLGYRQEATYHPSTRFWPFQWYETGIYTALALGLAGFCFWWIRRRLS